jgi:peptidoglycan/LPS O-acetylase OafA/YrhL
MVSTTKTEHSLELQSLRGIAAAIVLVHHALRVFDDGAFAFWFSEKVLNAHAAVVVFFVLSGYVLSRSLISRGLNAQGVLTFWTRRAFRIYPALWCGLLLVAVYVLLLMPSFSPHFSTWATESINPEKINSKAIVMSAAGFSADILPPAWTITVELVGSLLLPPILLGMVRGPVFSALIVAALVTVSLAFGAGVKQVPLYLVHFALGAWLATSTWARTSRISGWATVGALVILLYGRQVGPWGYHDAVPSLIEGLAAVVVIAGLLRSHARWLKAEPLVRLGDWSYSLYLVHIPIAFSLGKIVERQVDVSSSVTAWSFGLAAMTLVITLILSWLLFSCVEKPGIGLGNRVISIFTRPSAGKPLSVES